MTIDSDLVGLASVVVTGVQVLMTILVCAVVIFKTRVSNTRINLRAFGVNLKVEPGNDTSDCYVKGCLLRRNREDDLEADLRQPISPPRREVSERES